MTDYNTWVNKKGETIKISVFCRKAVAPLPCNHSVIQDCIHRDKYDGLELFGYLVENDFQAESMEHFIYLAPRYYLAKGFVKLEERKNNSVEKPSSPPRIFPR